MSRALPGRGLGGPVRTSLTWVVGILVASAVHAQAPAGVSPGATLDVVELGTSCPTYSWTQAPGATGYELVIYRVTASSELRPEVRVELPEGSSSWTPSASQCPESNTSYAWTVRAFGELGAGPWSEVRMFATPGLPSDDEVRAALGVLERYRRAKERGELDPKSTAEGDEASPAGSAALPGRAPATQGSALISTTTGAGPVSVVSPGSFALDIDGDFELGGFVFKEDEPFIHNDGGTFYGNTAVGVNALISVTPSSLGFNTALGQDAARMNSSGYNNTAVGAEALLGNTSGWENTAIGKGALRDNIGGFENTGLGERALTANTSGFQNTAVGASALVTNTTGYRNVAIGDQALQDNLDGDWNTALGYAAGSNLTTGIFNISIGFGSDGVAGQSRTIRIGGDNAQDTTYIEGIWGALSDGGVPVVINSDNRLGTTTSSRRFKEDIEAVEGVSDRLMSLRPVKFRYKTDREVGGNGSVEFGLIAEEVEQVLPELVAYDEDGTPFAVRYHLLPPLLLSEMQRQERELAELRHFRREVAELRDQVERLERSSGR